MLLSRMEDAGLNASAPPQQRWLDGWLLRLCPGKAKRARCVNALAAGRLPLSDKLQRAEAVFLEFGLPLLVRITPFSQPTDLDAQLAGRGFTAFDHTQVMAHRQLQAGPPAVLAAGLHWAQLDGTALANAVGVLRGSSVEQRQAHAQRLASSPVPYRAHAICRNVDAAVLACGQTAQESELVGLYDVFTHTGARSQGLATQLCRHLLALAAANGAAVAYLQVHRQNHTARRVYQRLGFADAYAYHYRLAPGQSPD